MHETVYKLTSPTSKTSSHRRRFKYRGQSFSSACLSCEDFAGCCGSSLKTQFDGAAPAKKPKLSRRDFLENHGWSLCRSCGSTLRRGRSIPHTSSPLKFKDVLIAKKGDVPVNGSMIYWFPFTTDPTYTNMLIHLPPDLASKAGNEFVSYNRTCIHLQCLVSYLGSSEIIGCPCHGSIYRPTDGWPIGGPAAQIGRYLPNVQLRFDGDNIYAKT